MSFNILAVRELDTPEDPLYPRPGNQPDSVGSSDHDGQSRPPITVSELIVHEIPAGGGPKRILRLHDIKAKLVVTDSRIAVACSKYDKGGGWTPWGLGAVPVAVTANVVSKVRASRRRAGKMLVGQMPYQRLLSVGCKPRSTPIGHDQLRLGMMDPTVTTFRGLTLDISLPRQQTGPELAQRIAGLAAAYRLREGSDELDDTLRELLTKLMAPPLLQPVSKHFASYFFIDTTKASAVRGAFQKT